MSHVLVINSGSSSVKYQLVDAETETRVASGLIERIGETHGSLTHTQQGETHETIATISDHTAAFALLIEAFAEAGEPINELGIHAVGHRIVQGGSEFVEPTLIDNEVAERVLALAKLAPLHNPGHHQALVAARAALPEVPHIAVFDTAFHQSIPQKATTYAIDRDVAAEFGIRRYGFHGTSHRVVAHRAAAVLNTPVTELKQIVLHLGNGASVCAIDGGKSVNTSMGMTPLEGLVMGSRSGDIDPGALLHLLRNGYSPDRLDQLLNKQSGFIGLTGHADMRDVWAAALTGDTAAQLAFDVYVQRVRDYLGSYLIDLGGADTIVFTAGVGENHVPTRAAVCADLQWLGIEIDAELNAAPSGEARCISTPESRITVMVVPTDEEAEIARQAWQLVSHPR